MSIRFTKGGTVAAGAAAAALLVAAGAGTASAATRGSGRRPAAPGRWPPRCAWRPARSARATWGPSWP
ncbi:hypothetical protein GXW82_12160 [Streptacidiphilus sp. 4-A2]|nr:hypothetical protein [Streptacidiphilus sp. 4-A2]